MNIQPYENISTTILAILVSGIVIYYLRARHRERMELIRQQVPGDEDQDQHRRSVLGKSILALSLGLGLLTGMCLAAAYPALPALVLYLAAILLCADPGLLTFFMRNLDRDQCVIVLNNNWYRGSYHLGGSLMNILNGRPAQLLAPSLARQIGMTYTLHGADSAIRLLDSLKRKNSFHIGFLEMNQLG